MENCANFANISSKGKYLGGLIGINYSEGNIKNCYNIGNVVSNYNGSYIGGLVGYNRMCGVTFENCYNSGQVSGGANYARGAFVGCVENDQNFINCSYLSGSCAKILGGRWWFHCRNGFSCRYITNGSICYKWRRKI